MRIIAFLTALGVIRVILKHLAANGLDARGLPAGQRRRRGRTAGDGWMLSCTNPARSDQAGPPGRASQGPMARLVVSRTPDQPTPPRDRPEEPCSCPSRA